VRAFALGNDADVYKSFRDFFEHMAAQKLHTPKDLDWIRSCYGALGQVDLMVEMQALRMMLACESVHVRTSMDSC
jgi:hypothetical protein